MSVTNVRLLPTKRMRFGSACGGDCGDACGSDFGGAAPWDCGACAWAKAVNESSAVARSVRIIEAVYSARTVAMLPNMRSRPKKRSPAWAGLLRTAQDAAL